MPEVFSRRAELGVKLVFLGIGASLAVGTVFLVASEQQLTPKGEPATQPIPFSHKHHVGDVGVDCRFCHASVDKAAFPGMPSTTVCLNCHSQLFRDAPALAPLHDSAATGRPLRWAQLHQLPDFVYFNHGIHVSGGVGCVECHGRIDQMPLVWRVASLQMQWCLDCHRNPLPHLSARADVYTMSPAARRPPEAELVAALPSRRRLTDCSTCHR